MIDKLAKFKKLKKSEQMLLTGLALALVFSFYFNALYKPLSRKISRYRFQTEKSASRLKQLEQGYPQIEKQRKDIQRLDTECQDLLAKITEIEQTLPNKKRTTQLLAALVKKARGLKLVSIRQKTDSGEEYSRIFIELKFNAPYRDIVNYIRKIEAISPFLVIEELDIAEAAKEKSEQGGTPTRLMISSLLGEIPTREVIKAEEEQEAIEVTRDIFVSKAEPVSEMRKADLRLEGITYNSQMPTAIINGEVTKIGSKVGNLEVKAIHPESVILTDGREERILSIER